MNIFSSIDEQQMQADIEKQITKMEQPDYTFPKRMTKGDYIAIGAVCFICLILIIGGYYL